MDIQGTVLAETKTSITIGWTPPPEQIGYVPMIDGSPKMTDGKIHNSWSHTAKQVTIGKPAGETLPASLHAYTVQILAEAGVVVIVDPKVIKDAPLIGLNITTVGDYDGYDIDGTGDSAVIFELGTDGSTLTHTNIKRAGVHKASSGLPPDWGVHAVYAKARCLIDDVKASCDPQCDSVFSLRFDSTTLKTFRADGAPHGVTYFETSPIAGQVDISDGDIFFTDDETAIYFGLDTEIMIRQSFRILDVRATGPGPFFLNVEAGKLAPGAKVVVEDCFHNGQPVTAAQIKGVPPAQLTILPVVVPPIPPGTVTHKELMDARVDHGKPFKPLFDLVQINTGGYPTQGKSHMVDAAWAKRGVRDVLRLSSPGFPSGPSPVPGNPWYERAQMGWQRAISIGERVCYGVGFCIPSGMDQFGNDLMFEAPHLQVGNYGPPSFLYVVPGAIEYRLQTGKVRTSGGLVWECSFGKAWGKSVGTQYAVPANRFAFDVFHQVLVESVLVPDFTGWVSVWHRQEGGQWMQTVSLTAVPTIQCVDDVARTVPSLNVSDLINLYVLAKPVAKMRDFVMFGRWDTAAQAKAELG